MSTPGAYHDECGGYHELHWGMFSTLGGYHEYTRVYHDECGDIMSTVGLFSTPGGYHEYNWGCSVH